MKIIYTLIFFALFINCKSESSTNEIERSVNEVAITDEDQDITDYKANEIEAKAIRDEKREENKSTSLSDIEAEPESEPKIDNKKAPIDHSEAAIISKEVQPIQIVIESTEIEEEFSKNEEINSKGKEEIVTIPVQLHDIWDRLLQSYVSAEGKVDYDGFKQEHESLKKYLVKLSSNMPQSDWSKAKKMAFWINAYNANTINLIVDHLPVKSILDLDNGKTWDVKRIDLGGEKLSLNNIEHDILRKEFKDARIHFAVNCAAISCPKLNNRAWTEENLEVNLERITNDFINNAQINQISTERLELSKIFEWYLEDFDNLIEFIDKYSQVSVSPKAQIQYNEYNWNLNSN